MGFRHGFFAVRGVSAAELPDALRAASEHAPERCRCERFGISEAEEWMLAECLDHYGDADRWAQAMSFEAKATVVSFFVLEGTWSYAVFDRGEHLLAMLSYPYDRPHLVGDARRAASLLGCDDEIFRRYHRAILDAHEHLESEDDSDLLDEPPLAYDDDDYPAADEYGYHDFARRIGVPSDPLFEEADVIGVRASTPRPDDWVGLPPMLPAPID